MGGGVLESQVRGVRRMLAGLPDCSRRPLPALDGGPVDLLGQAAEWRRERTRRQWAKWRKRRAETRAAALGVGLPEGRRPEGLVSVRISHRQPFPGFRRGVETRFDRFTGEVVSEVPTEYQEESCLVSVLPSGLRASRRRPLWSRAQKAGGERGEVKGFSVASRRRLVERLQSVAWADLAAKGKRSARARGLFLTLTYPDQYPAAWSWDEQMGATVDCIDAAKVKRDIDAIGKRLARWPDFQGVVWRLEIEPRKSGTRAGRWAPHFHLVAVFSEAVSVRHFRRWLSGAWAQVVGSGDPRHLKAGTRADRLYNEGAGRLAGYVAKYCAKGTEAPAEVWRGRWWGEVGKVPRAESQTFICRTRAGWEWLVDRVASWGSRSAYLRGLSGDSWGFWCMGAPEDFLPMLEGLDFEPWRPPLPSYEWRKTEGRLLAVFGRILDRKQAGQLELFRSE